MTELAQMFELQQSATFFGSWGGLALALLGAGLAAVLSGIGSDYYATRNFKKTKMKDYMTYKQATANVEETTANTETNTAQ